MLDIWNVAFLDFHGLLGTLELLGTELVVDSGLTVNCVQDA